MYIGGINIEKVSFSAATVEESFLYVCYATSLSRCTIFHINKRTKNIFMLTSIVHLHTMNRNACFVFYVR